MVKNTGYSGTPLYKKLGMKEGARWKLVYAPQHYHDLIGHKHGAQFLDARKDLDGIHIFTNRIKEVEEAMLKYRHQIKKEGMLWFSWYKKSSKMPTEVTEDLIRNTALRLGMVDVKVCAVDDKWSGLKIVWRLENR